MSTFSVAAAPDLFEAFFDLSLMGGILFAPVREAGGQVVDFAYVRLNPAAQRMLALPERPAESYLTRYPHARPAGIFAFYREAFESGEARHGEFNYQHDGLDNYFHLAARPVGEQLLVSFTDTSEQPRTAVEQALRASQAREQQARAQAEAERQRFYDVLQQLPALVATYQGPEHVYTFVNPSYQRYFSRQAQLVGRSIRQVLPEAEEQGIFALMDRVYQTGEPYYAPEWEVALDFTGRGAPRQQVFLNLLFHPLRDAQGHITGLLVFSYDVTEQVLARRQGQQLNQELEARVQERTRELQAAQAATERQRRQWEDLFRRAPAAICIFDGPEWVYEFINPGYQAMFPGRELLGKPLLEALPELHGQPLVDILHQVYDTGEPFEASDVLVPLARTEAGPVEDIYFDLTYQARYDDAGQIDGFVTYAYDVTAQVLARREREAQQGELQRVLEQAPVPIIVLRGPNLVVESANAAICALWGRAADQVLGRPYFEAVPDTAGQGFEELFAGVLATGQSYFLKEVPATLDRAHTGLPPVGYFSFEFKALYGPDEAAGPVGLLAVGIEVTDQVLARRQVEQANQELEIRVQQRTREAEAARAEAERQRGELERVFEQAPVAIAVYRGPSYTIELANATVARLWGRTREQLLGKGLFEALPEVAGLGFEELLDGVMATGVPHVAHAMEARHEREGRLDTVYWDFVYVPTYQADGRINGAMVVATEVTAQVLARRQTERLNQELEARVQERTRQLSEQQALLRQILGQVPASIATLSGPEHHYTFFNELYQSLAANRTELGLPVAQVFPEVVAQGFIGLLDRVYATGEPFAGTDVPAELYDAALGRPRPYYVDFIYQPLFDDQQRVRGILTFVLDVTDRAVARQQAEQSQQQVHDLNQELAAINEELLATNEELHQSNTRLTRSNNDLDTFVYTASHDLKAPITNIEGILEALRETLPPAVQQDPVVAHIMGLLDHTVGRFLTTIDQLTDLTRLQKTYDAPAELLRLAPVVADVLADLAPATAAAAAQLHLAVPADLQVSFAPASLRSIVYNLLSNAVKYRSPERPAQVWLRAEARPGQVVLSVQDNGLGLTDSQQGRLFGVFQRLHTHVEGTGVGLYMIKRLIENAGASIAVTSTPGVGSTFTVTFPT